MKRTWFAVAFIIICISACTVEQLYVKNFYENLNEKIITAEKEPTKKNIDKIQEYYKKSAKILTAICDTEKLDELNQSIKYLDDKDKEIGASLATARTINDSIYESQIVSASNIF